MNTIKAAVLAALLVGGAAACDNADKAEAATHRCRGDQTVFVWYPDMPRCNLDAGDTLNVGFWGSDGIERPYFRRLCNDMGGRLRWSYRRDAFVCRDVDF